MTRIVDKLFLGNIWDAQQLVYDNPCLIGAVLNVSTEPEYARNPEISHCHIPFPDGCEVPAAAFRHAMDFLWFHACLGTTMLVHCHAGQSRSPGIVKAHLYLRSKEFFWVGTPEYRWDLAHRLVVGCRPQVQVHPNIERSLKQHLKLFPYDGSFS